MTVMLSQRLRSNSPRVRRFIAPLLLACAVYACGGSDGVDPPPPATPADMVAVAGESQRITVGETAAVEPTVLITDAAGKRVSGVPVDFTVRSGGGTVRAGGMRTDGQGRATAMNWTMGPDAGTNSLVATSPGLADVVFIAEGIPGHWTQIAKIGRDQIAVVGQAVAVPPTLTLRDKYDNPVVGVPVSFQIRRGGGAIDKESATTDSTGTVGPGAWRMGPKVDQNELFMTVDELDLQWIANSVPDVPAKLAAVVPDSQEIARGTASGNPPTVRVVDRFDNPVPGASVHFALTSGGTGFRDTTVVSSPQGLAATAEFRAPPSVGTSAVSASLPGVASLSFVLSAVDFSQIATLTVKYFASCGITRGGQAFCWGENRHGELGDGTTINRHSAVGVEGGVKFKVIAMSQSTTCGLDVSGATYCWGQSTIDDPVANRHLRIPRLVARPDRAAHFDTIAAALGGGFCGLHNGGDLSCAVDPRATAVSEMHGLGLTKIAGGFDYFCALNGGGDAYCWSRVYTNVPPNGKLGDGTNIWRRTPTLVVGGHKFVDIGPGWNSTCAITAQGELWCWGELHSSFTEFTIALAPVRIPTPAPLTRLAGGGRECGLTAVGVAYCWRNLPVAPVPGGLKFQSITSSYTHSCGVTVSGQAYCWGQNVTGALGDGTTVDSETPVLVHP